MDISTVKISEVMTKMPRCIESHQPIEMAISWMDELKVRHLPVREAGKVVGIVSDRDLGFVTEGTAADRLRSNRTIEDVMISSVLTVLESQAVKDVAEKMLAHRVGSAVVTDNRGSVTGIFTDSDALKILCGKI